MTDAGNHPSDPVQGAVPPKALGLGYAELAALLAMRPGGPSTSSAAALRIPQEAADSQVIRAGTSSLVAHGLATVGPKRELVVRGAVAAILSALSGARRRVDIGLLAPGRTSGSMLQVESDEFSILLQPRSYLSWLAMAQDPGLSGAQALLMMVTSHLTTHPDGGATVYRHETPAKGRLLIRSDASGWTVGYQYEGREDVPQRTGLDDDALLAELRNVRGD
ncbi:hypothetical protein [Arthrobacter sp. SX1312]|uniref:hypothetical protein n=1 Tax=Arthrobacter sp. SX1312 TaxID=2058896 RepID=UPI000CE37947|nr:hypothetical protein [Arthrobacter sp. SX1312]